jgi:OOP family OmpA-OmpF porin
MRQAIQKCWKLVVVAMVLPLVIGCATLPTTVPAGTPMRNFYGGFGVGAAQNDATDSYNDGSVSAISTEKTDTLSNIFMGYQINEYVSAEVSYEDLGKTDFAATSTGGPSWAAGPVSATQKADGYGLTAVGRWPISERWFLIGKLGWFWWESEETFVESYYTTVKKESGSDFTYGGGLEFDHGHKDRIVYRFELDHHEVGNDNYNVDSATFKFIYRFP